MTNSKVRDFADLLFDFYFNAALTVEGAKSSGPSRLERKGALLSILLECQSKGQSPRRDLLESIVSLRGNRFLVKFTALQGFRSLSNESKYLFPSWPTTDIITMQQKRN